MVGSQMLPASVQIVNMRPGTPTSQNQQKMGNTQQARVLIGGPGGPQLVGTRPQNQAVIIRKYIFFNHKIFHFINP